MIPIDLNAILEKGLAGDKRTPDNLLHASSDLAGSLRHSQLRFVGAPERPRPIVDDIRLRTGTMWHSYINELLTGAGVPYMAEVNLTPWMPTGWSGTADWLFWHPEYEGFVLGDLKTTKGEAIKWKERDGLSEEHLWQLSAYWHALIEAGFPMLDHFAIYYLPLNNVYKEDDPEPTIIEAKPIGAARVYERMNERYQACEAYADSLLRSEGGDGTYVTDELAPIMERVQKLVWDYKAKHWNVVLVPHWLSDFCPYPNELCDCSEQGTTKVGHWLYHDVPLEEDAMSWDELEYVPRKDKRVDYSAIKPEVRPTKAETKRRMK